MGFLMGEKMKIMKITKIGLLIMTGLMLSSLLWCGVSNAANENLPTINPNDIPNGVSITFDRSNPASAVNTTMIVNAPDKTIMNFSSFNVGTGYTVNVNLPNNSSSFLARDIGGSSSNLNGSLNCNGVFMLVNTNGINVGPNANINVGSLVLSTRNITDTNFVNANYIFEKQLDQQTDRLLLNQGTITISRGGFGVLIAGAVENRGIIVCPMGTIALAGGDCVRLDISSNKLISIAIDKEVAGTVYDYNNKPITSQLNNSGYIEANGGTVIFKAESLPGIFEKAINMSGYIKADRVENVDGTVKLVSSGKISITGQISATHIEIGDSTIHPASVDAGNARLMAEELLKVAADKVTIDTSASSNVVEVYKTSGDIHISNSQKIDNVITIEGEGIKVTYMVTSDFTLKAEGAIDTSPAIIIQGSTLTLIAQRFGNTTTPLAIDANAIRIQRTIGDINIIESQGIGTSIQICGPPDGFGQIIYPKTSSLILEATRISLSTDTILYANNLSLIANSILSNGKIILSGDWRVCGTFDPGTGTVEFIDAGIVSTIYGNSSFYNLVCTTPGKTIQFEADTITYVYNTLTIRGSLDSYITLISTIPDTDHMFGIYINAVSDGLGHNYVDYINVYYSHAYGPVIPILAHTKYIPHELNIDWDDTHTWTGTINGYWSDPGNWGGYNSKTGNRDYSYLPSPGDDLVFPGSASNKSTYNDFGSGTLFNSITFTGSGYTLSGNSITLGSGGITGSFSLNTINLNMTLNSSININIGTGATLVVNGIISGSGSSIEKTGAGTLTLNNANDFGGTGNSFTLTSGTLNIGNASALGDGANTFIISGGSINNTSGSVMALSYNQQWNGDFTILLIGNNIDLEGYISLTHDTNITINGRLLTVGGVISGNYNLGKSGTGYLTLNGDSTFGGTGKSFTLNSGTLSIGNASALGDTANTFIINGGIVNNTSGSAMTLSYAQQWNGNFTFTGTNNLDIGEVTLGADTAITCNGSIFTVGDAISGTGNLTKLGGATLVLSGDNTFSGNLVMNGGTLTLNGDNSFGGSGKNVTLTAGRLNIGSATALGNSLNTLIINGGTTITNTSSGDLTLPDYPQTWNGNFTLAGTNNLDMGFGAITLGANTGITCSSVLTIGGVISGNYNLTKLGGGTLVLSGNNTFTGNLIMSAGKLNLNGNNSFGGAGKTVTLNGGWLDLDSDTALGNSNNTLIINGGTIYNTSGGDLTLPDYPQTWNANFYFAGPDTLNMGVGAITMAANVNIGCNASVLTIGGVISGNGKTLSKAATGTLDLRGNINVGSLSISGGTLSITGALTVGTLTITNATGILTTSNTVTVSTLTIGSGATLNMANKKLVVSTTLANAGTIRDPASDSTIAVATNMGTFEYTILPIIPDLGINYLTLRLNGSGRTFTLGRSITLTNINIVAGNLNSGGYDINISGYWSNTGTFTPAGDTVTFSGSGSQAISGNNTFHNIIKSGAGAVTISGGTYTLDGDYSQTNGSLIQSASFSCVNFSLTNGTFTCSAPQTYPIVISGNFLIPLTGATIVFYRYTGSGTSGSPYMVYDVYGLQAMRYSLSSYYKLNNNIDATTTQYWTSDPGFIPIGNSSTQFIGNFDGNGKTISNLYINTANTNSGLFGYTSAAANLSNINLSNVNMNFDGGYSGALVGKNYGSITNCSATGNVTGGGYRIGGLVGWNFGQITNSYTSVTLTAGYANNPSFYIGGLVGMNGNGVGDTGTIINCYSTGSTSIPTGYGYAVGGLVGENRYGTTITNCYSTGSVSGAWAGGLAGANTMAYIINSYSSATVTGNCIGGLVGWNNDGYISNSYATGSVSGTDILGGLAGQNGQIGWVGGLGGTITNCYSTGAVTQTASGGNNYVGGLVGYNDARAVITASFSTGAVTASVGNIGGLVGYHENIPGTTNCYWYYAVGDPFHPYGNAPDDETGCTKITDITYFYSPSNSPLSVWFAEQGTPWCAAQDGSSNYISYPYLSFESRIYIYNTTSLQNMNNNLSGKYYLASNITFDGITNFTPIGSSSAPFTGKFNGNGYYIANLYISAPSTDNVGLFGYTSAAAALSNIQLVSVTIAGHNNTGGLVGANYGSISNSYSTGSVSNGGYVGGLVGANGGSISNSYSTASVSTTGCVGGLVGYNTGSIINSYSRGSVSGSHWGGGGLVGWNAGSISNSYYSTGSVSGLREIGGLVGYNTGSIINSYSTGSVSNSNLYVGGLVGENCYCGSISNSYSTGSVTLWVEGSYFVGGLAGENSGSISNSYSAGSVSGTDYVGGLVGYNLGSISNSYGTGSVTATYDSRLGGFVGVQNGTVTASYWYDNPLSSVHYAFGTGFLGGCTKETDITYFYNSANSPLSVWLATSGTPWKAASYGDYPYLSFEENVNTVAQLEAISTGDLAARYRMGADIDMSGVANFSAYIIGNSTTPFTGRFNGNGYTISNLFISTSGDCVGLLAYTSSTAILSNIHLTNVNVTGGSYVGGLVGQNSGTITSSYATGSVTGSNTGVFTGGLVGQNYIGTISNSYSTATVVGHFYVGGLVGRNYAGYDITGIATISNCYATGTVTGTPAGGGNYSNYVGGLVGENSGGGIDPEGNQIPNSGGQANIENCYAQGAVSGTQFIGGLVGKNYADQGSASISKCYAVGSVTGHTDPGGLVGLNLDGSVSNSYWDTDTSGQSSSDGGTGKGTYEMIQESTYSGWDFTNTWVTLSNTYPDLKCWYAIWTGSGSWSTASNWDTHIVPTSSTKVLFTSTYNNDSTIDSGFAGTISKLCINTGYTSTITQSHSLTILESYIQSDGIFTCSTPQTYTLTVGGNFSIPYTTGAFMRYTGSGLSTSDPYMIYDVYGLQAMQESLSRCYKLNNNIDATTTQNWNSGWGFIPIGDKYYKFSGNFNGNSHIIQNLHINMPSICYVGLFGWAYSATISNIGLTGESIIGNNYTGGLVGKNDTWSNISNSYATGTVTGGDYTGGLVGYNTLYCVILNSYATATVTGGDCTGGLVGYNSHASISQSYYIGTVIGNIDTGGLVGSAADHSYIYNSYAGGTVTGSDYTGGLAGSICYVSNISNSYTKSTVISGGCAGGLVGQNSDSTISNSYAAGEVSGSSSVGGFVGYDDVGNTYTNDWYYNARTETQPYGITKDPTGKSSFYSFSHGVYTGWDLSLWAFNGTSYPTLWFQNTYWTGLGSDNNWSTAANWSTNSVPTSSSCVFFNSIGVKNSTIDYSSEGFAGTITWLGIASGYTGVISQSANLTISGSYYQSGGTFNISDGSFNNVTIYSGATVHISSSLSVSGSWNSSQGAFAALVDSTVTFNSGTSGNTINTGDYSFYNLTFNNASGGWTMASNLSVNNDLEITNGKLNMSSYGLHVERSAIITDETHNGTLLPYNFLQTVKNGLTYWMFYYSGTSIEYGYSGTSGKWTTSDSIAYNTPNFSVASSGGKVFAAVEKDSTFNVVIKRGTFYTSSITFDESEYSIFSGVSSTNSYSMPAIAVATDNYLVVAAMNYQKGSYYQINTTKSKNLATTGTLGAPGTDPSTYWYTPKAVGGHMETVSNELMLSASQGGAYMTLIIGNASSNIVCYTSANGRDWNNTNYGGVYALFAFPCNDLDGNVYAAVMMGSGTTSDPYILYIGGSFTSAGGITVNNIAEYKVATSTWSALNGGGLNDDVTALAVIGQNLYVGGYFTATQNGATVLQGIAKYNSLAGWFAMAGGIYNENGQCVNALTVAPNGTDLYVGGYFSKVGGQDGTTVNNIAKYNTVAGTWSALNADSDVTKIGIYGDGAAVYAITAVNTDLYVGGQFTSAGGNTASNIAKYTPGTSTWSVSDLGAGVNNAVLAMAFSSTSPTLYVGGGFTSAGGNTANYIATYNTNTHAWSALGTGVNNGVYALAVTTSNGNDVLYVGGDFTSTGVTQPADYIAKYSGSTWSALGAVLSGGGVRALVLSDSNTLYAGGMFTQAGEYVMEFVGKYTPSTDTWTNLTPGNTGTNGTIYAMVFMDGYLYVGGNFTVAGGVAVNNIAEYDPSKELWYALGSGVDNTVYALAESNSTLYVGGYFYAAGGIQVNGVAKYTSGTPGTGTWSALGGGVDGYVRALAVVGSDLYVGGNFTTAGCYTAGEVTVNSIAKYATGTGIWSALTGSGVSPSSYVLSLSAVGSDLYVGGNFTTAGGTEINRIAKYDTVAHTWSGLGAGVNDTVYAITAIGTNLYIGGTFTTAGGNTVNHIAEYVTTGPGTGWHRLFDSDGTTPGVNGTVRTIQVMDSVLYVGGDFTYTGPGTSGLEVSRVASYTPPASPDGAGTWAILNTGTIKGVNDNIYAIAISGTDMYIGGSFNKVKGESTGHFAEYTLSVANDAGSPMISLVFTDNLYILYFDVSRNDLIFKEYCWQSPTPSWGGDRVMATGSVLSANLGIYDTNHLKASWSNLAGFYSFTGEIESDGTVSSWASL